MKKKDNWFLNTFRKLWYGGKDPIKEYDFSQSVRNPWADCCCKTKKKSTKKNKKKRSK